MCFTFFQRSTVHQLKTNLHELEKILWKCKQSLFHSLAWTWCETLPNEHRVMLSIVDFHTINSIMFLTDIIFKSRASNSLLCVIEVHLKKFKYRAKVVKYFKPLLLLLFIYFISMTTAHGSRRQKIQHPKTPEGRNYNREMSTWEER